MKIFQVMAGFSLGGADNVRRIMSKKKPEKLPPEKKKFIYGWEDPEGKLNPIPGALALGHDEAVAERVFEQMAKFAGYAFNKSHAAAYAYVSYQTGYLKVHYEIEYLTAVLNNRITSADSIKKYTNYARIEGFTIYPPDINKSYTEFKVENGNMRFGLGALKHVGTGLIDSIVEERNANGDFKSFEDFLRRVTANTLNRKSMEALILSGAFDCFGHTRSQLMEVFPKYMELVAADRKAKASGQYSFFDTFAEETKAVNDIDFPDIKEFNKETLLKYEKEFVGIYLSGHPLDDYLDKYEKFNFTSEMIPETTSSDELSGEGEEEAPADYSYQAESEEEDFEEKTEEDNNFVKDGQSVIGGGIIKAVKKITTKSGNMAFLTIEDLYGTFDVMLFSKLFNRYKDIAVEDGLVTIKGKISIRDGKSPCVIAEAIIPWDKGEKQGDSNVKVYLRFNTQDPTTYNKVKSIASSYPGNTQVIVRCTASGNVFSFNIKVEVNNYLTNELIGLLGEENVVVK